MRVKSRMTNASLYKGIFLFLLLSCIFSPSLLAQVTIGTTAKPMEGAILDLKQDANGHSTKGLMLPRVKLDAFDELLPSGGGLVQEHIGLIVYNVGSNKLEDQCAPGYLDKGPYVWDGAEWKGLKQNNQDIILEDGVSNFIDGRDSQGYLVKNISKEVGTWMLENLRAKKYAIAGNNKLEGSKVVTSSSQEYWSYPVANGETDFTNSRVYDLQNTYGFRYSAAAALAGKLGTTDEVQGVCPTDWHIPSKTEWEKLFTEIKDNPSKYITAGSSITASEVGKAMKDFCGNGVSKDKEQGGFAGLLTGANIGSTSIGQGEFTYFWSSTGTATNTEAVKLDLNSGATSWESLPNSSSMASVRCIQTATACLDIVSAELVASSVGGFVEKGKELTLTVTAIIKDENTGTNIAANPADLNYKWMRTHDGEGANPITTTVEQEGKGLNIYKINEANPDDHTGEYVCVVSSSCSEKTTNTQDVKVETIPPGEPGDSGFTAENLFDLYATPSNRCGDVLRSQYATDFSKPVRFEFVSYQKYTPGGPTASLDNLRFLFSGPDADLITAYETMVDLEVESSGNKLVLVSYYTLTFDHVEMKKRGASSKSDPSQQRKLRIHVTALFSETGTPRKSETDIIIQDCQACGTDGIDVIRTIGKNEYRTFTAVGGQCWMSSNSHEASVSRGVDKDLPPHVDNGLFFTPSDINDVVPIYGVRLACPRPWRMPTQTEINGLLDALRLLNGRDPMIDMYWLGGLEGSAEGWKQSGSWDKRGKSSRWWYAKSKESMAFQEVLGAVQLNKETSAGDPNHNYLTTDIPQAPAQDWRSIRCVLDMKKDK